MSETNLPKEALDLLKATGVSFGRQNPQRKITFKCPECGDAMDDYISFLAPVYETFMCAKCGGIFYQLVDKEKLNDAIKNAAPHLIGTAKKIIQR